VSAKSGGGINYLFEQTFGDLEQLAPAKNTRSRSARQGNPRGSARARNICVLRINSIFTMCGSTFGSAQD
jgi:hypothetical protein